MKKIAREYEFSQEQFHQIKELAKAFDLHQTTAKILFARGIDTPEKIQAFLHPSAKNFLSPFLMKGMKEAVALLKVAREEEWRVAVFGDYDADGIGACAIMHRALMEYGIQPYLYVPERVEGYGMSVEALDKIFDEFLPDLFITVDCGISNRNEVEYIKEQGAYVIVTDHHELPEVLPDCICINPKLEDDYPYDNLCGAGVAFKVAQALIGEKANALLDFAALSTVADSVSLLGENRDIVSEGLRLLERKPRPAFAALLGKTSEITAQTLAFTVAPRINAAGRMGDANAALQLFTTEDENEIFDLAAKLNAYNQERQKSCDELYAQAVEQIKRKGAYGHVIMLVGEEWNAGFVGIVAARIAEEYSRPALLFVRKGDMLKGSARSIETVNIFEALRGCSHLIAEFGGHAQAAGINVTAENFDALEEALNDYIGQHYTREDFIPTIYVTEEIRGAFPVKLARELNALEPFGVGHRRPLFITKVASMDAKPVKPLSPHVTATTGAMDFLYFSGAKHLQLLRSDLDKTVVFECNLSKFRGKESLKGFIRTVIYDGASGTEVEQEMFENNLLCFQAQTSPSNAQTVNTQEMNVLIENKLNECAYGLCLVASDRKTLEHYPALQRMDVQLFAPFSGNVRNTLLVSPRPTCDLSAYRDVLFLDRPAVFSVLTGKANVYVNGDVCGYGSLRALSLSREELLGVFTAIRNATQPITGKTYAEAARSCGCLGFSEELFILALIVFEELELISFEDGRLRIFRGKRTELTNSTVYSTAMQMLAEE